MGHERRDEEGREMSRKVDCVVIGGGPAGLSSALALYRSGVKDIVILERESALGGILRQCIHDGFGLDRFGENLSGPEYASHFIREIEKEHIPYITNATVMNITPDRHVTVSTREGVTEYEAKAVILAMGCKERSAGSIALLGERPAGVYTAGTAQAYMNLYNRMPGKNVIILGSGDIGLIMARRLTLEGAKVSAVFELMPSPNGLPRNIVQCLYDYDIPLYLNHTVTKIYGRERIEGVDVSEVDSSRRPIPGSAKYYPCDTLILSVGLIPENTLLENAGIMIDPSTSGAVVDEHYETSLEGVFSCGNVLHVHDLADAVTRESENLASSVKRYLDGEVKKTRDLPVKKGNGIGHVIPQRITSSDSFLLSLRVRSQFSPCTIALTQNGRTIAEKKIRKAIPATMIEMEVDGSLIEDEGEVEVSVL